MSIAFYYDFIIFLEATIMYEKYCNIRDKKGLKDADVAKATGISASTFSDWKSGRSQPKQEKLKKIASALGVSLDYLTGQDDTPLPPDIFPLTVKKFPLLGEIACGEPIFANEDRESYIMSGTDIEADFCLKAKGDSMMGARILDGDIVFIKKTDIVNNGEIAAVIIEDEVLLKRFYYYKDENLLTLQSENPRFAPKNYIGEQLDHIRVLGKAVAFQSDIL